MNKTTLRVLAIALFIIIVLGTLGVFYSRVFLIMVNIFWLLMFATVIIFLFLGVLVMIGLKKEAGKILDVLFEGTLTIIDIINFIKKAINQFIYLLKEFILLAMPYIAMALALVVYFLLLYLYKWFGSTSDVTIFTVVLTFAVILLLGIFDLNNKVPEDPMAWKYRVGQAFKNTFRDSLEVVIFIFFLTMDSTNLFFLPKDLNLPLKAEFFGYDFMKRGFVVNDHYVRITSTIIIVSISIEMLRHAMKIIKIAFRRYSELKLDPELVNRFGRVALAKQAVRGSFYDSKTGTIRFITFTTVLIFVFLMFPRLKLLAMAVTSIASILLDLLIPDRLLATKQEDLISRVLGFVFRV